MNPLIADLGQLFSHLVSRSGLIQLAVIASGLVLAWGISGRARRDVLGEASSGSMQVMAGSFNRVVLPLIALVFIWLARLLLGKFMDVDLLQLAIPVLVSFVSIRLLVYLVRHLVLPSPLLKASERVIVYSMWTIAVVYITGLMPELETALSGVAFTIGKQQITLLMVMTGIITVLLTMLVAMTLSRLVEKRIMAQVTVNLSLRLAMAKALQALAVLLAILTALPLVGIDLTVLSVFSGAIGVGLGLGLQKVASNYVSGFIMLLESSVRVGDLVAVDNKLGVITGIHGRYTVVRALEGTEALIPNEVFITQTVVNHTLSDPKSAVRLPVTVAYDTDINLLEQLLKNIAVSNSRVLKDPPPGMLIKALGDNGIEVELVVWVADADQGVGTLRSDLLRDIWKSFSDLGIEIPFPQREVRHVSPKVTQPD